MPSRPQRCRDITSTSWTSSRSEALAAATAATDLHVGAGTRARCIFAAAFDVPAVVIFGGYIEPSCTSLSGEYRSLSPVPCTTCWLTELCPFGHPCLHQITPRQVDEALKQLWEHRNKKGRRGPLVPTDYHDTAFSVSHGLSET